MASTKPGSAKTGQIAESDGCEGYAHPRENPDLAGHSDAERTFLEAYRSGRLHHAWLIAGPEGIGKATFAYRAARFMLEHPDPAAGQAALAASLHVDPDSPVFRRVAALGEPDLFVARRSWNAKVKRLSSTLPIQEIRKLIHFFTMTAAGGGWRVAIIDCADDMNFNAVNALLKTLEEPPERALLLLISHAPGRLPATIRSRCRRLNLRALPRDHLFAAMRAAGGEAALSELSPAEADALVRLSRGSVRRALGLLDGSGLELYREITAILEDGARDRRRVHKLADRITRRGAEQDYAQAIEMVTDWIADRVGHSAEASTATGSGTGADGLARLAEVWEKITHLAAATETYHFDRKQVILKAFRYIATAMA